jgi:TfoX/Sxy family transcriptional regulator of competence genes
MDVVPHVLVAARQELPEAALVCGVESGIPDASEQRFTAAGRTQFCFTARGKLQATRFWSAPADAMDSPALMRPWAQLTFEAALRARAKSKKRR